MESIEIAKFQPVEGSVEPILFTLPRSKSECNRMLVLQAVADDGFIRIKKLSEARDTTLLQAALRVAEGVIDVEDAGTAMRFATAFHALKGHQVEIRGTLRMHQRPIAPLVTALRELGAKITYLGEEGYPPLRLEGCRFTGLNYLEVQAGISSQFITALLLVAPLLKEGLRVKLLGEPVSTTYIDMTISLLNRFGVRAIRHEQTITVFGGSLLPGAYEIEADWSAAGYAYSLAGLTSRTLLLSGLRSDSLQGDRALATLFSSLGVATIFREDGFVELRATPPKVDAVEVDFTLIPDQAQTLIIYCLAKRITLIAKGLSTLRVKETDRILALQTELRSMNGELEQVGEDLFRTVGALAQPERALQSYDDHRMAMSLAPLAALFPITLVGHLAVAKSFPNFWDELAHFQALTSQ